MIKSNNIPSYIFRAVHIYINCLKKSCSEICTYLFIKSLKRYFIKIPYFVKTQTTKPKFQNMSTIFSIDKYFLFYFFKGSKVISQRDKKIFFIRNLRAFCIYFLQVLPAKFISWCHLILMKNCPWITINFALWKWWHLW